MIPPRGFAAEMYPLHHRVQYGCGLCIAASTLNTVCMPIVRHTSDVIAGTPQSIVVNPHNTLYVSDAGTACCKMSILDKLRLSIKFNMTEACQTDAIQVMKFQWRPIFFSFGEKLAAADDDTGTTVETLLGLTSDSTFEDVVPLTTTKLIDTGQGGMPMPVSTVNIAEVFGDFNMTTDLAMEDQIWDEDLFLEASRRYTNKGALKSMVGRTRHESLTLHHKPYKNYYFDKFLPKAIRRIMPYTFMAIQVHLPEDEEFAQALSSSGHSAVLPHLGIKMLAHYDEWNSDHWQGMTGAAPAP